MTNEDELDRDIAYSEFSQPSLFIWQSPIDSAIFMAFAPDVDAARSQIALKLAEMMPAYIEVIQNPPAKVVEGGEGWAWAMTPAQWEGE